MQPQDSQRNDRNADSDATPPGGTAAAAADTSTTFSDLVGANQHGSEAPAGPGASQVTGGVVGAIAGAITAPLAVAAGRTSAEVAEVALGLEADADERRQSGEAPDARPHQR